MRIVSRATVLLCLTVVASKSQEQCSVENSLRLVGGTTQLEGRVEICQSGRWGTVCDDFWDDADAQVVCAQLGYARENAEALLMAAFGQGQGAILMDDVVCNGTESRLVDCPHTVNHNCGHYEDAGVICVAAPCSRGDVRLVNGGVGSGRVEVCLNGWGTVCDDRWNSDDASVVCRQLGFSQHGARAHQRAHFGRGTGAILLDDVSCSGTESRLIDCRYDSNTRDCTHFEDAGVTCRIELVCSNGDVRLVGGAGENEGRVEVCINEQWGTVCDDSWGSSDAGVVCRQLGYVPAGAQARLRAHFGRGTGAILLDDVSCSGTESRLIDCRYDSNTRDCSHFEDAGVTCRTELLCSQGDIRLVGGTVETEGRVEVCISEQWGTVCNDGWNTNDAAVVCRQLGYSPNNAVSGVRFGAGSGPIFLDNVACSGSETRLTDCRYDPHTVDCEHSEDAGVRCEGLCTHGDVRIGEEGRVSVSEGRVEVCLNQEWGTVCDDGWNSPDARVVCQQLGFSRFNAVARQRFGAGLATPTLPILLDEVRCTGMESRLVDCRHVTTHDCRHAEDAGVQCNTTLVCENGDIRLVGGASESEGRVEVCWNETWGTVCDQLWSRPDAQVACGQLGFSRQGATPLYNAPYSQGSGPILLRRLQCTGMEANLTQCPHSGVGVVGNCRHRDDAGVVCSRGCTNWDLRLVNGRTVFEGRVEMCFNNEWGTVCDDYWNVQDARVVCRQLGLPDTISALSFGQAMFGIGTGPILLDDVRCIGTETSLQQCSALPVRTHNCAHFEDAGVRCSQCVENSLRLVGGASDIQGLVEVCLGGGWGRVCEDHWTIEEALVVCRQLGLPALNAEVENLFDRLENLPVLMSSVRCNSTESRLTDCQYREGSCALNLTQNAGVICGRVPPPPPHGIFLSSITSSSVVVTWTQPLSSTHYFDTLYHQINCSANTPQHLFSFSRDTADNATTTTGFSGLSPYTNYTCCVRGVSAGGVGGTNCQTFTTLETAPNGPPRGLHGNSTSSVSLELSWAPPPIDQINGQLREYYIRINILDTNETRSYITTATRLEIAGLHPYYRHECSVAAVTVAPGPYTEPVTIVTDQDAPSGFPTALQATILSPRAVQIVWNPPPQNQRNGIITGYVVAIFTIQTKELHTIEVTHTSATIETLPYSSYTVTVAARTSAGQGPTSESIVIETPEDAPSDRPQNVTVANITPTSFTLLWAPPPPQYHHGNIRQYNVRVSDSETSVLLTSSTTEMVVTDRRPYTLYNCSVAAVTVGEGPHSAQVGVVTAEDAPVAAPRNVRVQFRSTNTIRVVWSAPLFKSRNGLIRRYDVRVIHSNSTTVQTLVSRSESITLSRLTAHSQYLIQVAAFTIALGPFSSQLSVVTREDVPGPPGGLTVNHTSPTTAVLQWHPVPSEEQHGVIRGHWLQVASAEDPLLEYSIGPDTLEYQVDNLRPVTVYNFSVAAETGAGRGLPVVVTSVTPLPAPSAIPAVGMVTRVSTTEVQVSWDPLTEEESYGSRVSYLVRYRVHEARVARNIDDTASVVEVEESDITLSGLEPHLAYAVAVAAKNERGSGEYSDEVIADIFENSRFRVHLQGPIVCLPWIETGVSEKMFAITQSIASSLQDLCKCDYSSKYIAYSSLNCGDKSTNRVILEATLVSTTLTKSDKMREMLQGWVNTEPKVIVQGVQLTVVSCSVLPLEEGGQPCPLTFPATTTETKNTEKVDGNGLNNLTLIGGVAGGLALLTCMALSLIVIVMIMKRRYTKRERTLTRSRDARLQLACTLTLGEDSTTDLKGKDIWKEEESKFDDDEHIYDEPSKYFEMNSDPPKHVPTDNNNKAAAATKIPDTPTVNKCTLGNTFNPTTPNEYVTIPQLYLQPTAGNETLPTLILEDEYVKMSSPTM